MINNDNINDNNMSMDGKKWNVKEDDWRVDE